jgi:EAL domain-containing protein (putative c-di-GMP-specific phosphodiesterase class I)
LTSSARRVRLGEFGSGFGSFSYLKHLPFDVLKNDGDFVRMLPQSHAPSTPGEALG